MIPAAAVEAAAPLVSGFMERRGFEVSDTEAELMIGYVLEAAAPHIINAWITPLYSADQKAKDE